MLWFAVHLPQLSLEVFTREWLPQDVTRLQERLKERPPSGFRMPDGPALAICQQHRVLISNEVAQILGVHAGTKRATALALAPEIQLLERDPSKENNALQQIAQWLLQFTPTVSLEPPGVVLEISGSLRLFGGVDQLSTLICAGLLSLGYRANWACAPTARGAWLLAQYQSGCQVSSPAQLSARLASIPLSLLPSAKPHLDMLCGLGLRTLKDLICLPRPGLARRFGPELLREIDQALGRIAEPRKTVQAAKTFLLKLELLAQVEQAQALLFAGRRMLMELQAWLTVHHAGVRSFTFKALHDDRPPTEIRLELAEASRDLERLCLLLRERLDKLPLPQPAHSLELSCQEVVGLNPTNEQLFPSPVQVQESLERLVERLQGKLGQQTVQSMQLVQEHRPERAYRLEPVKLGHSPWKQTVTEDQTVPPLRLPRPLWLMPSPEPIQEQNSRPWYHGPLKLLAGPERIESGWWDDDLVQRDYFIAEDVNAVLYWIYRTRGAQTSNQKTSPTAILWFVQGVFG